MVLTKDFNPSFEKVNQRNVRKLDKVLTLMSSDWWEDREGPNSVALKSELERAGAVQVKIRGKTCELGWLARNRPSELERIMGSTSPNHRDFWAIVLVYNHYERRVNKEMDRRNSVVQSRTIEGLSHRRTVTSV